LASHTLCGDWAASKQESEKPLQVECNQKPTKRETGPTEANQRTCLSWGYRKAIPHIPGIALVRNFSLNGRENLPLLNGKQGRDAQLVLLRKQRK